ncbi:hypothetical protein [Candidatus Venteria ishoeyi]|uniref:Uncharacterized protein n=1 Tax=Candidatus Venteria ishoeyi TaxID=1899563 RepID=A0A1H6FCY2_9GAMM|nr:hypothetical protein [Candidatus Venteria ishoeyi]MDM8545292.1 hypothetical protein [Candidatus Venteria ishoeyi]SEH07942.1 Uncharacterised protein [Candidatus Venteria ishoeyi]
MSPKITKILPWAIGAGIAGSHIALSSNCSLPKQGACTACGSCVIALATLSGWAWYKNQQQDKEHFFVEK